MAAASGIPLGAEGYEQRRRSAVWQRIVPDRHPATIVRIGDADEVGPAISAARRDGRRVAVLSSGHSYIADALQDDAVLLDLTALDRIAIDPGSDVGCVGPAATNGRLDAALDATGRAFPVGHSPTVAVGGSLLGGGLGWNPDGWGIAACDRIAGATVALASGRTVHLSADEHPDLFWALRGAGPCFPAVVLEYELRLVGRPRAIVELSAGYPLAALDAVAHWADTARRVKDRSVELAVMFTADPRGGRAIAVGATAFASDADSAAALLAPLVRLLPPGVSRPATTRRRTLAEMLAENDAPPQRYDVDGVWSDDAVQALLACGASFASCPSPDSLIHVSLRSHPELPPDAAFSVAGSAFVFASAVWDDPADDAENHAWQDALQDALGVVSRGRYVNETDYVRHPARLRECFTREAWARIERVQTAYDPQRVIATPNRTS